MMTEVVICHLVATLLLVEGGAGQSLPLVCGGGGPSLLLVRVMQDCCCHLWVLVTVCVTTLCPHIAWLHQSHHLLLQLGSIIVRLCPCCVVLPLCCVAALFHHHPLLLCHVTISNVTHAFSVKERKEDREGLTHLLWMVTTHQHHHCCMMPHCSCCVRMDLMGTCSLVYVVFLPYQAVVLWLWVIDDCWQPVVMLVMGGAGHASWMMVVVKWWLKKRVVDC